MTVSLSRCLLAGLLLALTSCASRAPIVSPIPDVAPAYASIVAPDEASWSLQSRLGREAIVTGELDSAEVFLIRALARSNPFRSRDTRVDVSFGNLVRLAAAYEKRGRADDAVRVMTTIRSRAQERRISARKIAGYDMRYEGLIAPMIAFRPDRSFR